MKHFKYIALFTLPIFLVFFVLLNPTLTHAQNTATNENIVPPSALATALAEDRLDVTAGFHGDRITLFGTQKLPGDIVIVLEGPPKKMRVRRKENVSGIWMNKTGVSYKNVPSFYAYAVSNPSINEKKLDLLNVGIERQAFTPEDKASESTLKDFRNGLIRNKKKQNLFVEEHKIIEYIADGFFRTDFYIPANVSIGKFKVKTYLLNAGEIVGTSERTLNVEQVGTGATIFKFSHTHSLLYGLLCVAFAASIGWLSNAVRSRLR